MKIALSKASLGIQSKVHCFQALLGKLDRLCKESPAHDHHFQNLPRWITRFFALCIQQLFKFTEVFFRSCIWRIYCALKIFDTCYPNLLSSIHFCNWFPRKSLNHGFPAEKNVFSSWWDVTWRKATILPWCSATTQVSEKSLANRK